MSKLIADKTIKFMIQNDKKLKGAKVLVLGATFKEDCPDMRNSKVLDIIKELEEFECQVDIYDYWIDKSDLTTKNFNFIDKLPLETNTYDAIIVAVGHSKFKDITTKEYESMSNSKAIVIDVKGIVDEPSWRL